MTQMNLPFMTPDLPATFNASMAGVNPRGVMNPTRTNKMLMMMGLLPGGAPTPGVPAPLPRVPMGGRALPPGMGSDIIGPIGEGEGPRSRRIPSTSTPKSKLGNQEGKKPGTSKPKAKAPKAPKTPKPADTRVTQKMSKLARFLGPAFLAMYGIDVFSRMGQERRREEMELAQLGMMGLFGGHRFGYEVEALAIANQQAGQFGMAGALSQGMNIPTSAEMELATLLGRSGAQAAEAAAVTPQMDEVALNYVLGMT